jgi:hypothetical protein
MMYAVTVEPLNSVCFLTERPEESRWEVQEGIQLDIAANYADWPPGEDRPEQILCVSASGPRTYKLFKNLKDIDPKEFLPSGRNFGGLFSKASWERFVKSLEAALPTLEIADEAEPPGATEEAIGALKREG